MTVQEIAREYLLQFSSDSELDTIYEMLNGMTHEELSDVIYSMASDIKAYQEGKI